MALASTFPLRQPVGVVGAWRSGQRPKNRSPSRLFPGRGTGRQRDRHAETEIAVAEVRWVAVAHGTTAVHRDVAPATTTHRETLAPVQVARIGSLVLRIRAVPARTE